MNISSVVSSTLLSVVLLASCCCSALSQSAKIDYTRDIRPILSNTCFHCHGPDEDARQADLRLDTESGLSAVTIQSADLATSEFVRRIVSHDPDEVMPPPDSNKTVTQEQRDLLLEWVNQGAKWQQHWAFKLPTRPALPNPSDLHWPRNPIDHFILSRMEDVGLQPAEQAAPHTLLRRIYLDLIGLPPTISEADEWLARIWGPNHTDSTNEPEWLALADHLMNSPHYGERWARRWLDLARYADTNGYEKDRDRSIWPYRDWVVNAINSGMPFDRFTVEQLAGDMLPNATVSQKVATGFHRNTMLNEEGGIDPLEFRYNAMTDRVATTGTTWLGLTLGCCQCHTHKYDPVSHHEYFQVFAYLNNADEPYLNLPDETLDRKFQNNKAKAQALIAALPEKWPVTESRPVKSTVLSATGDGQQQVEIATDQTISVSGRNPATASYVVELQQQNVAWNSIQLATKSVRRQKGPGRTAHGNFVLSEFKVEVVSPDGVAIAVPIKSATASAEQDGYPVSNAFDGKGNSGWAIHASDGIPKTATATFVLDTSAVPTTNPTKLRITLSQQSGGRHTIGQFHLSLQEQLSARQIAESRQQKLATAFEEWKTVEKANAVKWTHLVPTSATSNLPILTIQDDNSIFASGDTAKRDDYVITLQASDKPVTSIRLEALPDERLPAGGPGSTYYEGTIGDFYLTELKLTAGGHSYQIASASHTYAKNRYGNNPAAAELAVDGDIQTGWSVHGRQGEKHVAVFELKEAVPAGTPIQIDMAFGRHFASSLGRFRFSSANTTSSTVARNWPPIVAEYFANPPAETDNATLEELNQAFLLSSPKLASHSAKIRDLLKYPAAKTSLVLSERPSNETRPTFRHHRGEYLQPKDQVYPRLPEVLQKTTSAPANRLEFARWLVSESNPMTARVVVNRQWAAFFGTGIVKTVDDFGLQGEFPSHPELLDWLAVQFSTTDDWSIRKLHRLIVSSATYQQSSAVNSTALKVDPENRLLSYSPRYRLDAEIIRDQLLVAAGVLSPELGGPPVRPLQPAGVTEAAYGKPKWSASSGAARYRRSLYTYAKRTAPFAMFSTFDAPSGEACIARRDRSNSPLQALTLLNDVMLMDLARQTGIGFSKSDNTRLQQDLNALFRKVLIRKPTSEELDSIEAFYQQQLDAFTADSVATKDLLKLDDSDLPDIKIAQTAAWAATARVIFGLDETLTRE